MVVGNRVCFRLDFIGDFDRDNFDEIFVPVSSIVRFLVTLQFLSDSSSDEAMKASSKSAMVTFVFQRFGVEIHS
jgi:hypothetical protein